MKKFLLYFSSTVLLFIYILSYIGFGIHKCTCNGTTDVVLLIGDTSCEKIHTHIHLNQLLSHTDSDSNTHHHHCDHHNNQQNSDECCKTEILVLTDAQDNRNKIDLNHSVVNNIIDLLFISDMPTVDNLYSDFISKEPYVFPEPYYVGSSPSLPLFSQWRL